MLMLLQLRLSWCAVVNVSRCACFPLTPAKECCCLQCRLPVADLPPAPARQQSLWFCGASEENQPGNIFRAPGTAILATLCSPSGEHVFVCAACWELLCILRLPISAGEVVRIVADLTRIELTKLENRVPVLAV